MSSVSEKKKFVVDAASKMGEFSLRELAEKMLYEEVLEFDEDALLIQGAQARIKRYLKTATEADGSPTFVALEMGANATWKVWTDCSRVECRLALQVLACTTKAVDRKVQAMKRRHEAKWNEVVTVPKTTNPRGWEFTALQPPVTRKKKG